MLLKHRDGYNAVMLHGRIDNWFSANHIVSGNCRYISFTFIYDNDSIRAARNIINYLVYNKINTSADRMALYSESFEPVFVLHPNRETIYTLSHNGLKNIEDKYITGIWRYISSEYKHNDGAKVGLTFNVDSSICYLDKKRLGRDEFVDGLVKHIYRRNTDKVMDARKIIGE